MSFGKTDTSTTSTATSTLASSLALLSQSSTASSSSNNGGGGGGAATTFGGGGGAGIGSSSGSALLFSSSSSSTFSSSSLSEWQKATMTRMQERAQQLVQERRALSQVQEKLQVVQAAWTLKQKEHANLQATYSRQQLERYTHMEEYHTVKRQIQQQERRSEQLQQTIARYQQEIDQEQQFQENMILRPTGGGGGRKKRKTTNDNTSGGQADVDAGTESTAIGKPFSQLKNQDDNDDDDDNESFSKINTFVSFLDHAIHRRLYMEALKFRIRAKEQFRQQRQARLDWLYQALQRLISHAKPQAQSDFRHLERLEQTTRQEMKVLIQESIPNLANQVRQALTERGRLRHELQQAQTERDQARAIMDEAERYYLERTKKTASSSSLSSSLW
ncbi:hypothetical protein ACA910_020050 [Epithemia clementina (nom. ined.)]